MTDKDKHPPSEVPSKAFSDLLTAAETASAFRAAGIRWRAGELNSRFEAVEEALGLVLSAQFPDLSPDILNAMIENISVALLHNQKSADRIFQLLGGAE